MGWSGVGWGGVGWGGVGSMAKRSVQHEPNTPTRHPPHTAARGPPEPQRETPNRENHGGAARPRPTEAKMRSPTPCQEHCKRIPKEALSRNFSSNRTQGDHGRGRLTTVSGIREIDLPTEHLFGAVPTRWRVLNGGAREVHRRWTGGVNTTTVSRLGAE